MTSGKHSVIISADDIAKGDTARNVIAVNDIKGEVRGENEVG